MAKAKIKTKTKTARLSRKKQPVETDSTYVLKLVLYLIVGTQWLHITRTSGGSIPIPVGLVVGLLFSMHEHFQIDRKIEYAVLLMAAFIGFWLPMGIEVLIK